MALALLAWLIGGCRRPIPWRTVIGSSALMLAVGAVVFLVPATRTVFLALNDLVVAVLRGASAGAEFLFGPLALGPGQTTASGEPDHYVASFYDAFLKLGCKPSVLSFFKRTPDLRSLLLNQDVICRRRQH